MTDAMNGGDFVSLIGVIHHALEAAQSELNALDSALGDGDHGGALAVAFGDAAEKARALPTPTPSSVLQTASQSLLNRMGGASGALYGTLFLRMSIALRDCDTASLPDWQVALQAGLVGVTARGKAAPGDKTMVDALAPAVAALVAAGDFASAFAAAATAAQAGAEQTVNMVAKFGRAKFAGERAIGHVDAGARSMAILFGAINTFWQEREHGEG
jgi:dihydroxyacetone kinase-like protein